MSGSARQEGLGSIDTPLGTDAVLLRGFDGEESLTEDFEYRATVETAEDDADLNELLGEAVCVRLALPDGGERAFGGIVVEVTASGSDAERALTMVPWLALLAHSSDCRVYRESSVVDIVDEVFSRHGALAEHEWRLYDSYPSLDFTVQYAESDRDFVVRLLERHGIYRYYEHDATSGRHVLILSDHLSLQDTAPGYGRVAFDPDAANHRRDEEVVHHWHREVRYAPSRYTTRARDYRQTHTRLEASESWADAASGFESGMERYDWPGPYTAVADAERRARVRGEALQAHASRVHGETTARGLVVGRVFTLVEHPSSAENGDYLIVSARFGFDVAGWRSGANGAGGYACSFDAVPTSVQFRPFEATPTPHIHGVQSATVAGPAGEELWCDEYGAVKLEFPWDRSGLSGDRASGWVRVSQVHAGKGFGAIDVPRVGEEVLVQYHDGDPDRPVVIGRVYNDFNTASESLPSRAAVSGMRTNSTPGGGGHNEILIDDTKGEEHFSLRAEKDLHVDVGNDHETTVGAGRTLSVGAARRVSVAESDEHDVGTAFTLEAGTEVTIKAGASIRLEAGGSTIELGPTGITIKSGALVTVQGSLIKLN